MGSSPECVDAMGLAYEIDFQEVYHTRTGGRHPSGIRFRERRRLVAGGIVTVVLHGEHSMVAAEKGR